MQFITFEKWLEARRVGDCSIAPRPESNAGAWDTGGRGNGDTHPRRDVV
jgi:hypothetical protein